jgi:hypothetical protein
MEPLTTAEVTNTLAGMGDKAARLDRITLAKVKGFSRMLLTEYLNLLLVTEAAPVQLTKARITMVPKIAKPSAC